MEHTKGKWETRWRDIVVKDNNGGQFRICTMIQHINEAEKEDKANARLIAAAPELLEACKAMKKILSAIAASRSLTVKEWEIFGNAEQAIAEAEAK